MEQGKKSKLAKFSGWYIQSLIMHIFQVKKLSMSKATHLTKWWSWDAYIDDLTHALSTKPHFFSVICDPR